MDHPHHITQHRAAAFGSRGLHQAIVAVQTALTDIDCRLHTVADRAAFAAAQAASIAVMTDAATAIMALDCPWS